MTPIPLVSREMSILETSKTRKTPEGSDSPRRKSQGFRSIGTARPGRETHIGVTEFDRMRHRTQNPRGVPALSLQLPRKGTRYSAVSEERGLRGVRDEAKGLAHPKATTTGSDLEDIDELG